MPFDRDALPYAGYYYADQCLERYKVRGEKATACCPFHNDKTPSFHVDLVEGKWKCFGCGEAGDIIAFQRKRYHQEFREACEELGAWS